MRRHPLRILKGIIVLAIVVAVALYVERLRVRDLLFPPSAPVLPEAVTYQETKEVKETKEDKDIEDDKEVKNSLRSLGSSSSLASSPINLAVPFTSQAPTGNWDAVHEETCEEAAIYMAAQFYKGVTGTIDPSTADTELLKLVDMEKQMFGYFEDTTAAETAQLEQNAFGYKTKLLENPSADDLRAELAAGHPVIVPSAGQMLGNPYFTGAGPLYHMLVLRGYVNDTFISNDPGTRHGEAYVYSVATIMNALHDWNGGDVANGKKVVIVVLPN